MNFEAVKTALIGMTWKESVLLADAAGVPRSTVAKVRYGQTDSPRVKTVEKLVAALKRAGWL